MSVQDRIYEKLQSQFMPSHFELINESHQHSVPPNSETHFKVVLVSDNFTGKRLVQRHQLVYKELNDFMAKDGVHAVALHTYTPSEWAETQAAPDSPNCMGGSKAE